MKKLVSFCVLLALTLCLLCPVYALDTSPLNAVTSGSYIVIDQATGQILVNKNADSQMYPASTTKILTMALAMQKSAGDFSVPLTVSYDAVTRTGKGSTCAGFLSGEEISLADAMYGCLIVSGNDAANVLAEYVSGSIDAFVTLMNETVAQLGLTGTHFSNTHGYFAADHYTTTSDMAKITQYAMSIPGFAEFFGATTYTMPPTNMAPEGRVFNTSNIMLVTSTLTYEGTTGGKSGWTEESRFTQVITCTRGGRSFIVVVFDCPKKYEKFRDCIALLDYCYGNFTQVTWTPDASATLTRTVLTQDGLALDDITLTPGAVTFQLPNDLTLDNVVYTPAVAENYTLGGQIDDSFTLSFADGTGTATPLIATAPMTLTGYKELLQNVEENGIDSIAHPTKTWLANAAQIVLWVILGAVGLFAAVILIFVLYCLYLKQQQKKRRAARRRREMQRRRRLQQQGRMPVPQRLQPNYVVNGFRAEIGGRQRGTQPVAVNQNYAYRGYS